jgi:hypothetical protein
VSEPGPSCGNGIPFLVAIETAREKDDAALEELLGPAQLIGVAPKPSDQEWSFETRAMSPSVRPGLDPDETLVFPVRKVRPRFFASTILVGRAASSDVLIEHPSISKLHARITRTNSGLYAITDAGSKNGTWVAGRRVTSTEVALPWATKLQLGDWELRLYPIADTIAKLRGRA